MSHPRLIALLAGLVSTSAQATTIYVNASAAGSGSGTSWTDAFTTLQPALAAAQSGDEIWVAAGVYTPADASSSFVLRSGVAVLGGFGGTETSRQQRNPSLHTTTLSGDVGRDDTDNPSPFVSWPNSVVLNTPNAGHVIDASGVDALCLVDGFLITAGAFGPGGLPAGDPLLYGGGIYCVGGSPTISNCTFINNFAAFGHGGAIFIVQGSPSINRCTFFHNLASQGSGGAIYVGPDSTPAITDCAFTENLVIAYPGQTGQGGAIQLDTSANITIARCTFTHNLARAFGGGSFEIPRAGAISSFALGAITTIRECFFRSNQATMGGAVFAWNPTTILNCAFYDNTAFVEGGAAAAQWTTLTIINSTIAANTGAESAGVLALASPPNFPAQTVVRNSIIWGNRVTGQDVSPRNIQIRGPFTARNSCIQDLFTVDPGEDPVNPAGYPGCFVTNPLFINIAEGDLHLSFASPCIDAANNTFLPVGTTTDLDAHARILRGLPGPGTPVVDMGAFEFALPPACPADFNHSGAITVQDIFDFLSAYFNNSTEADFNTSGSVTVQDIFDYLAAYFAGCV